MLSHDERRLASELAGRDRRLRGCFALACATRLRSVLVDFAGRTPEGRTLDASTLYARCWCIVDEPESDFAQIEASLVELLPDEDDADPLSYYAEDAISALIYALRSIRPGGEQDAVWAARRVYEAVDLYAQRNLGTPDFSVASETAVLQHVTVQAELKAQARDLSELIAAHDLRPACLIVRERAFAEHAIPRA